MRGLRLGRPAAAAGSCPGTRPPPAVSIVRDCGFSVPLAGKARRSLWLFCDTLVTTRQGRRSAPRSWAPGPRPRGQGRAGRGPGVLTEVATPAADGPGPPRAPGGRERPAPAAGRTAAVPARAGQPDPPGQPAGLRRAARLPGPVGHREPPASPARPGGC